MKVIKYEICSINEIDGEEIFSTVLLDWSEANEAIAMNEAHHGFYEIIDDGRSDPKEQPTQLDIIEAQVAYTALMTDTLLV